MTDISVSIPWALGLALAVTRSAALVMSCALIPKALPKMARTVIALGFALFIAQPTMAVDAEAADLIVVTFMNLILGFVLGWFLGLFTFIFPVAGSLVDSASGVSLGSVFDPEIGTTPGPFAMFYQLGGQTLIAALGGFTVVIQVLWGSTKVIPLDGSLGGMQALGPAATDAVSSMFQQAIVVALPIVAVLFVAELAFGLLSRLAPGINMFLISLPVKTLMVMSMIGTAAVLFPRYADNALASGVETAERLLGG